ncbi:PREDICTED: uncharacterized protein LOC106814358 [Priapulus caudatus]|uniref:Uncharacterized protein LOC106814358 n=1 Tax=Priapulus caudatus TaxID=37621 RepID=A0ABM1EPP0_PRICU|nr:PREDICTED: uncharacterized protein LOC106814358 [Priapulus caudatus]
MNSVQIYGTVFVMAMLMKVARAASSKGVECRARSTPQYLADPWDCSRYYICLSGVATNMHCGTGLHWNIENKSCDWPYKAKCGKKHAPSSSSADDSKASMTSQVWNRRAALNIKPSTPFSYGWHLKRVETKSMVSSLRRRTNKSNTSSSESAKRKESHGAVATDPEMDATEALLPCQQGVNCTLPDCYCGGTRIPGGLPLRSTPQLVMITFDDAVTLHDYNNVFKPLFTRTNPNGCPIRGTFYVSHQYTDYTLVNKLWVEGHEIASHSIRRFLPLQTTTKNAIDSPSQVSKEHIRGMRAPYLAINGDVTFSMMHEQGFTYDSSMPVHDTDVPSWPYTMDFGTRYSCTIQPCPKEHYPGIWELPMNQLRGQYGFSCPMVDGCPRPANKRQAYEFIVENFHRHYDTNRAPMLLAFHAGWLRTPDFMKALEQFLDEILSMGDVWVVTADSVIDWMRTPTPVGKLANFAPFACARSRPDRCPSDGQTTCPYVVGLDTYYVKMCKGPCPSEYPWVGSPSGEKCSYRCEFTAIIKERNRLLNEMRQRARG